MNLKVVIEQSEDGNYFIYVPSLPGVLADGKTRDEAIVHLKTALTSYLEPSEEDLPSNRETIKELEL
jgi:predicted RNase H-like HicB family nuclease